MSDTGNSASNNSGDSSDTPSSRDLLDAAVSAMRECETDSSTTIDGAPRGAVVDVLQDEHDVDEEAALQAIVDAQMAGRAYITKGPDEDHQQHVRAPDDPDPMDHPLDDADTSDDNWSDIDPSKEFPDSPEDLGIPPEEAPPDPPEEEPQPTEEEPDHILDDDHPEREPEFPGMMSGESIRLRGDEDEEWREPRSPY